VTPSNVTGLSFALVSGRRYWFKFVVTYQTALTTTGIGFLFTGPTMTSARVKARIRQAAAGTDSFFEDQAAAVTTALVSTGVEVANTDYYAEIEGFCTPSANGTLQLQVRSEVNASQVTVQNQGMGMLVDAG
jgi:hypothetical protein